MREALAFLYVCVGILLLALSYHLGARSAWAQGRARLTAASIVPTGGGVAFTAAKGRTVHVGLITAFTGLSTTTVLNPVPGTARIASTGTDGATVLGRMGVYALLETGEVYVANTSAGVWNSIGTLESSPPAP